MPSFSRATIAVALFATTHLSASFGRAQSATPIDPDVARRHLLQARALARRDSGRLWGRSLEAPLLLVDPSSRMLVSDEADSAGALVPWKGLHTGRLPGTENTYNGSIRWAGRTWAMILWPLPKDSVERGVLLTHELWHRVQESLAISRANPANPHLSSREGRTWLRLEGRALARAVASRGAERRAALADAVAFRRHRRELFPPADSTERMLERSEGLAEDTGVALASGDPATRSMLVERRLRQLDTLSRLDRAFPYRTGPAYGLLLDDLLEGWRGRLSREDDLASLALAATGEAAGPESVEQRAARYGYAEVASEEDAGERAREARRSELRSRLVTGPVLVLPLAQMKVSFDPERVESLPDAGTVYETLRLVDRWGVLVVSKGGALINGDWTRAVVPAPEDASVRPLSGEGWTLELMAGWRIEPGRRAGEWTVAPSP